MVLKEDGSVWATGWNNNGQLGDGSTTDRINYAKMIWSGVKAIAAGSQHSMMLKKDGSVWATGHNAYGQLGDGTTTKSVVFVQVISDGATAVAAGNFHSMLIKQDGSIWATGWNQYGQLGDGSTKSSNAFARLAPFVNGAEHDTIIYACPAPFLCVSSNLPPRSTQQLTLRVRHRHPASVR